MKPMTRALIVDDKEENLYYLHALLTSNGYTVQSARDGEEALANARRAPPDIVISDLLMPVMDGFTLLRHWKADARLKQVPFIVYTATYGELEDERLARSLGADAFILKPPEPDVFLAQLHEVLANAATVVPIQQENPAADETVLLKSYSETLIRKLEEKTLQLEESNRALQQDIAARKQAETALQESEQRLDGIVTSAMDAIVTVDEEKRIVLANPAAEKMFGYAAAELRGQPLDLLMPERFRAEHSAHIAAFGEAGVSSRGTGALRAVSGLRRSGEEFPIEASISKDESTGRRFFTAILRDITERQRAANELRESERRFSELLGNVELASVMLDREAKITFCNEYLLRLIGWRHEDVIGRDWFELFIPSQRGGEKDSFAKLLDNAPDTWHRENEILTRSGESRRMRWHNLVLRSAVGDVAGSASIGEDITERKMAEQVLAKRAAELERFHRLSVGRELQMIELKKQINEMARQAGQKPPHDLAFLGPQPVTTNPGHEKTS
jgi:PAS domain S-box-containing protein